MPRFRYAVERDEATPDERRALFLARREALDHGTSIASGGAILPAEARWGWRATVRTLGRDQDGSLLASITVTDPDDRIRVLRNVRLVKERTLLL